MPAQHLRDRHRLALAMAYYLRQRVRGFQGAVPYLIQSTRPRKLGWSDGAQPATDNADDPFASWSASTTPFYFIVDLHVAGANIIMDHPNVDLDLQNMYTIVTILWYQRWGIFDSTATITDGHIDFGIMDPMAAAAAVEYRLNTLDYLMLPSPEADVSDWVDSDGDSNSRSCNNDDNEDQNSGLHNFCIQDNTPKNDGSVAEAEANGDVPPSILSPSPLPVTPANNADKAVPVLEKETLDSIEEQPITHAKHRGS